MRKLQWVKGQHKKFMHSITIRRPDDFHIHLRDLEALPLTVSHVTQSFARALVMPNLSPPIVAIPTAIDYYNRIKKNIPKNCSFEPLMSLYLTEQISAQCIYEVSQSAIVKAIKWYPKNVTTNAKWGVDTIRHFQTLLEALCETQVPLLIHGETSNPEVDFFDREAYFLEHELEPILKDFPNLKVVLEHISTKISVEYIREKPDTVGATITAHHLWLNRNDLFLGGLQPHHYCLPVLKRREDQEALIYAATSGNKKFFLGTDSAPHPKNKKEATCGCAGIYSAPFALELYATIFEKYNALDKLENFSSGFGADFYNLPRNTETITLEKKETQIPAMYPFGNDIVIPLMANKTLPWSYGRHYA